MKYLKYILILIVLFSASYQSVGAVNPLIFFPSQGGTGTSTTPTADQILIGGSNSRYDVKRLVAGTDISIATSSGQVVINSTGGAAAFDFTPQSYGNSTSTTIAFLDGLFSTASTTIVANATTTLNHAFGSIRVPTLTSALLQTDANGLFAEYTGTTCTNQFVRVLSALGVATCATVTSSDIDSSIVPSTRTITVAGTADQITSSAGAQDLSANRTWTLSLPSHVIFPTSYQASIGTTTNATSTNLTVTNNLIVEPLTSALVITGAGGSLAEYAGTTCTNQFTRALSVLGVATCETVSLTADVTGTLPIANGGTNASAIAPHMLLTFNGTSIVASSTPTAARYTATSSTASLLPYASTTAVTVSGTASTTNLIVSTGATMSDGFALTKGLINAGFSLPTATTTDIFTIKNFLYPATIRRVDVILDCPNGCFGQAVGFTFNLQHGTNRAASTTGTALFTNNINANSTTTVQSFTTGFGDATLAGGETLWFGGTAGTAASTTQMNLALEVYYTND